MSKKQGLFIVVEGIDGSGKTTQIKLLAKLLKVKEIPFEVISFPQYGKNKYADKVESYLKGEQSYDSYSIAKVYAEDRKTAKDKIKNWLDSGKLVIANRYVSSSEAHLAANLPKEKREEFMRWLDKLEYRTNGMPRQYLTILLNVNPKVAQKNVGQEYDIHEESLRHLEKASSIYLELSQKEENWQVVNCMDNGKMKSPEEIHKEIVEFYHKKFPT